MSGNAVCNSFHAAGVPRGFDACDQLVCSSCLTCTCDAGEETPFEMHKQRGHKRPPPSPRIDHRRPPGSLFSNSPH